MGEVDVVAPGVFDEPTLLEIDDLSVTFSVGSPLWARARRRTPPRLRALDHVSLRVARGDSLGIVGESGCGKSTLARTLVGLQEPTGGNIRLDGLELGTDARSRRRVQMVFQDPGSSLNPRMTVGAALRELLRFHALAGRDNCQARCDELMAQVELSTAILNRRPGSLSGGQRQRVAIARALALEPEILIADEAVAALDVSVQASVMALLNRLRRDLALTLLFISHDLAVVRQVCTRIAVLYLGRVVEDRPTDELFDDPQHPYTAALMAAAPRLGRKKVPGSAALTGEPPSPLDLAPGCRFAPRCPRAVDRCREVEPVLTGPSSTSIAACHLAWGGAPPRERTAR